MDRFLLPTSFGCLLLFGFIFPVDACEIDTAQMLPQPDGSVIDQQHKLTWMRCSMGQIWKTDRCEGQADRLPWWDLKTDVASFNTYQAFLGHTDWRLPTKKELEMLIETSCFEPAINKNIFPRTASSGYWTADIYEEATEQRAWLVFFLHGQAYFSDKSVDWFVRLVRDNP